MGQVKFFSGENIPLEMHKARMVQRINLLDINSRHRAINEAGNNTFLLKNRDVFLDMLSDSGVNAMSERQYASMFMADDAYAGSETYYRLQDALNKFFGTKYFLPAHQGRACENILANTFVKPGSVSIMNYHFTTTKALITRVGGEVIEAYCDEAMNIESSEKFKGNIDINKMLKLIDSVGSDKISFIRIEAGTNLIGGQPISLQNVREVSGICKDKGIMLVFDASLLADNLYFMKTREEQCFDMDINDITKEIGNLCDIVYFSARKLGCARGGGIVTNNEMLFDQMKGFVPLFEGFLTYGGMSVREMEAISVGLMETLDIDVISQTPLFVSALTDELIAKGVPVVTPSGGLGCHIDASRFVDHIPQNEYPSGALACAIYLAGGIRGMERGTMSEQRNADGSESFANMELVRLAMPKRVFSLSHVKFVADRLGWLYKNRKLIGGIKFVKEPKALRFFLGTLAPIGDWQEKLVKKFFEDMPEGV